MALRIINKHLKDLLASNRFLFILKMFLRASHYRKKFMKETDDQALKEFKQTFLLIGVLYHELEKAIHEQQAKDISFKILHDIAIAFQREWYKPKKQQKPSWNAFHAVQRYQSKYGLIRHNKQEVIEYESKKYHFSVTRCVFHETFVDMGIPWITEAFCRSDEIVFNEYSSSMKFHRGDEEKNTVARGGTKCTFIFENFE